MFIKPVRSHALIKSVRTHTCMKSARDHTIIKSVRNHTFPVSCRLISTREAKRTNGPCRSPRIKPVTLHDENRTRTGQSHAGPPQSTQRRRCFLDRSENDPDQSPDDPRLSPSFNPARFTRRSKNGHQMVPTCFPESRVAWGIIMCHSWPVVWHHGA